MSGSGITRRRVLAAGVTVTTALAFRGRSTDESRVDRISAVMTFYDSRFPLAEPLARRLPEASRLMAVRGDPSSLVAHMANRRGGGRLRLQGVTTETIPFCLQASMRHARDVSFESRRLNRDLFIWALEFGVGPVSE